MKTGASNQFLGTVVQVQRGTISDEIDMELSSIILVRDGGTIAAIISSRS